MMYYSIFSCALLITKLVNYFFYHSQSFTTLWLLHKSCHLQNGPHLHLAWLIYCHPPLYLPSTSPPKTHYYFHFLMCLLIIKLVFSSFFFFFFPLPHHSSLQLLSSAQKLSSTGSSFAFCLVGLFTIPIPAKNPLSVSIFSCAWQFPHHQTSSFSSFPLQHSSLPTTIFCAKSLLSLTGLKFIVDNPISDKSYLT